MKALYILVPVVCLLALAAVGATAGKQPEREAAVPEYETAVGQSGEPGIQALSSIKQAPSLYREEEDIHEEGWEFYTKRNWTYRPATSYGPRHYFAVDQPSALKTMAVQAPVLRSQFPGIIDTHPVQPDTRIAVGPNHILLGVNYTFAIFTKTGQKLFQTSFAEWFKSLNVGTDNLYDPKVIYDQYNGHYIFLCDARRADKRSFYLFSVSKTSDPTGEWAFWLLDMGLNGTARQDVLWADFPRVGVDEKAIYLTGNMTTFGSYLFKYAKIRILKKSQVYSFQKLTWRDFYKMKDGTGFNAYSIEPVQSYGSAPSEYLVNTSPFTGSILTLWNITNATTTPVLSKKAITVSAYEFPPPAVQKGGGAQLATRECGVYNAVSINGSIYTAHNVAHNWGTGTVSAIRFYQVKTTGELVQEITYGADKYYYFYPAVMADGKGNVILGYNRSSAGTFAGVFYTGRRAADPPGKFQPAGRLSQGFANYKVVFNGTDIGRWGDYQGIALDSDNTIWFFGQYTKSPLQYGTQVAQFVYP